MTGKCSALHQLHLQKDCSFTAGATRHFMRHKTRPLAHSTMFNSPTITVSKHRNSVMPHSMLSKTHINLPFDKFSLLSRKPPKCGCFRLVVRPGLSGNGGERICQRTKMKEAESIMLYNINCKRINVTNFFFYLFSGNWTGMRNFHSSVG